MGFKVFNLQCEVGHTFEGWFASAEEVEAQSKKGFIECPYCGSTKVKKALSAPYVNRSRNAASSLSQNAKTVSKTSSPEGAPADMQQLQAKLLRQLKKVLNRAEDVGDRFAEEALKMHRGETQERAIRGQATLQQCEELLEEGVGVLPIPEVLDPKKQN